VHTKLGIHAAVLLIAAIAMLAFGSTVATASGKHKQTLRLVATENQSDFLDLGAPGPSLGDELVISETLRQRGREVGQSGVVCVVTEATPPYDVLTLHCVATLSLRRGQITLQGLIEVQGEGDSGPFTVAITGGTGEFFGAGGEARIRNVSEMRSVYKLRFDDRKKKKHRH
jgi:allene oxide cyclase-like protein